MRAPIQNRRNDQWIRFFIILTLYFFSTGFSSNAIATPALQWLSIQNNADGSYAKDNDIATSYQATSEVLKTFKLLSQNAQINTGAALGFINAETFDSTEYLARKITANAAAGNDTSAYLTELGQMAWSDGGFGEQAGYQARILDTALALDAMAVAGQGGSQLALHSLSYLLIHQNPNGGWTDSNSISDVYVSAIAAQALLPYKTQYPDAGKALTAARNFLLSKQGSDGLWGASFESAQALLALMPVVQDVSTLSSSVDALNARQLSDGSWEGDVYTTALAARISWLYQAIRGGAVTDPDTGALTGYVVLAGTGDAIAGATVSPVSLPGISVTTNADGYFVLPGLSAGQYTLVAQKSGYTGASVVATAIAGQTSSTDKLVLNINSQTGLVAGTIIDRDAKTPVSGAQISLNGGANYSISTDSHGYFEILAAVPGDYTISIQKTGFYAINGNLKVAAGQSLVLNQALIKDGAAQDSNPIDISASIVDAKTKLPLAGVNFLLNDGRSAVSDNNGQVLLTAVPVGSYQATISLAGYETANLSLLIPAGADGKLGALVLSPSSGVVSADHLTIYGTVLDGVSNQPISNASISRTDKAGSWTSNQQGQFIADNITDLTLQLSISAPNHETRSLSLTASAFGGIQQQFVLPPSSTANGDTSSNFTGKVIDQATQAPVSGAQIKVDGTSLIATSDSNGDFQLQAVPSLAFTFSVSKAGYQSQSRAIQLTNYGNYSIEFDLDALPSRAADVFQILSLSEQAPAGANSVLLFSAQVGNLTDTEQDALIQGEIFNANGESVGQVIPYAPGTTDLQGNLKFNAKETQNLIIPWQTAQMPAGSYRLVLRVVKPGTVSSALPTGIVLDELSAYGNIEASSEISGVFNFSPPLSQVGSQTPVQLDALVLNKGNTPLQNEDFILSLTDPASKAVIYTAKAKIQDLAVSNNAMLSFGAWVPSIQGNVPVTIRPANSALAGEITGTYYVGDKATGSFTLDKTVVGEGTQTTHATVSISGVDTTQHVSTDPLFYAVRNAVQTGADYTAKGAKVWQSNRCLGCHIQTQSQIGVSSAYQKKLGSEFNANTLFNTLSSSQQDDGGLRVSHPEYTRTQTTLGAWSLTSWDDIKASFRTLYKAGKHLYGYRGQSGNQTWWSPDHPSGWWYSSDSHTAMTVKAYAKLIREAEKLDLSTLQDYQVKSLPGSVSGVDIELGADGLLYTVNGSGQIIRVNPQTGAVETIASGLGFNAYGIALAADGSIYVSGYGKLIRRNPNGSVDTLLTSSGYLTDVDIGPDGLLYVVDFSQHRILRLSTTGQTEVLATGGLLSNPYGMVFDTNGQIVIANYAGFNILKLDTASGNKLTLLADGLAYPPLYITTDPKGGFYYTSYNYSNSGQYTPGGISHLTAKGLVERFATRDVYGVLAANDHVYMMSSGLFELTRSTLNTDLLPSFKIEVDRAANYFLANYKDGTSNNIIQAMRLMGLAEARPVITDAAKLTQVDAAIQSIAATLRSRQRSDGGWGQYTGWGSDAMVTALVGLSMDYTNPAADDPLVRSTINNLLASQQSDHSWYSSNGILGTRLAATSLVVAYLPVALDRLGGLDVDLNLNFPANISLNNTNIAANDQQILPDGSSKYHWHLLGVTANSRNVEFDLTFKDMQLNETRLAADSAYMGFSNSFNNETLKTDLDIPSLKVKNGLALTVTTDKPSYLADETVNIALTASNSAPAATDGLIQLEIRAFGSSDPLAVLPAVPVAALQSGSTAALAATWLDGNTLAGEYQVYGRLYDSQNRLQDEGSSPFKISAPNTVVESSVLSDKPVYQAWSAVDLTGRVVNASKNAIQAPVIVEISVQDSQGKTVYTQAASLGELLPVSIHDLPFSFNLNDAIAGNYQVELKVKDAFSHAVLSISHGGFTVDRQLIQALSGKVSAAPVQVYQGDPVQCTETANYIASVPADNVKLTSQLLSVDSGKLINEISNIVTLSNAQSRIEVRTLDTTALDIGTYACVLIGEIDGNSRQLGLAAFDVLQPPIRIDAKLKAGDRGRVLVLLDHDDDEDCHEDDEDHEYHKNSVNEDHDCDEHHDDNGDCNDESNHRSSAHDDAEATCRHIPDLATQRQTLEKLLKVQGWSYTLTTDADSFTKQFHSGGYVSYLLLSEDIKLSETVQQELREAVYRGEGLVEADSSDQRQGRIDEILGIKFKGKNAKMNGFTVLDTPVHGPASALFRLNDKTLRAQLLTATALAYYNTAGKTELAASTRQYGLGRAVYFGFDLLAEASLPSADPLFSELLLGALSHVHPVTLSPQAGGVYPVRLSLSNKGKATPGQAVITLPSGVNVVDSGGATVLNNTLAWPFSLVEDQTKIFDTWVSLPQSSVTLTALVQTGTAPNFKDYTTVKLDITPLQSVSIAQIIVNTQALDAKVYKKVLSYLQTAEQYRQKGNIAKAIDALLQACDALIAINTNASAALRTQVANAMRNLAQQL